MGIHEILSNVGPGRNDPVPERERKGGKDETISLTIYQDVN